MKQYWVVKKDHFDWIVLFRRGDWYVTFFHDSIILNQVTDKITRTSNSDIGFHHTKLDYHIKLLLEKGYKIIWMEQLESGKQWEQRMEKVVAKRKEKNQKISSNDAEDAIPRELTQKYTPATFLPEKSLEMLDKESIDGKYILVLRND